MYVCVCHAFTDKQVKKVLEEGARTTAGVYKSLGHRVQCGKCVPYVRGMVEEHRQGAFGVCIDAPCGGCDHDQAANDPANEEVTIPYGIAAE